MKHILNPIPVLLLIVCSLVFCQCSSRRGPYNPQLVHIDSLLNQEKLDTSAVSAAFRRVSTSLDGFDDDNRMYYNLLTQFYQFKTYQPVENDSVLRAVIQYYGDEASKEGLLANYIATGMYYDRGDYNKAQDCGLRFLRMTDKTSDFDKRMRAKCHLQLDDIYLHRIDSLMVLEQCLQAVYWAEQTTDTLLIADCYSYLSQMYRECEDYRLSLASCDKAYDNYTMAGNTKGAARVWVQRAQNYMALKDWANAKLCLNNYESMTSDLDESHRVRPGRNNEIYYGVKGILFERAGCVDSAFQFYYLELASPNEVFVRLGSGHLAELYDKLGVLDSAKKYYVINQRLNKAKASAFSDKNMQRKQIAYDLEVQKEKEELRMLRLMIFGGVALLLVLFCGYKKRSWLRRASVALVKQLRAWRLRSNVGDAANAEESDLDVRNVLEETSEIADAGNEAKDVPECSIPLEADVLPAEKQSDGQVPDVNPFDALQDAFDTHVDHSHSRIVRKLKSMAEEGEGLSWRDSSWRELEAYMKKEDMAFGAFLICLQQNCKRITSEHIRVCVLIRLGFQPMEISTLLNISQSGTTNVRRNLATKIFRDNKSKAEDLDLYIKSL